MSYRLRIGALGVPDQDGNVVALLKHAAAPQINGQRNEYEISYDGLEVFCCKVDLLHLYERIAQAHPGSTPLTPDLVADINEAQRRWNAWHFLPAGFGWFHDPMKWRLRWLAWWANWALEHTEYPVVANR
jgi:hypothetical protein